MSNKSNKYRHIRRQALRKMAAAGLPLAVSRWAIASAKNRWMVLSDR